MKGCRGGRGRGRDEREWDTQRENERKKEKRVRERKKRGGSDMEKGDSLRDRQKEVYSTRLSVIGRERLEKKKNNLVSITQTSRLKAQGSKSKNGSYNCISPFSNSTDIDCLFSL